MNSNANQHIINIVTITLAQKELLPVIMIDGEWGCGKTFFAKQHLIPALTNSETFYKVHYISLYGVTNSNSFIDKVISKRTNADSNTLSKFKNTVLETGKLFSESGGGVYASSAIAAAGIIREKILSKLPNDIYILDDLERVDVNAQREIVGVVFNLADSNRGRFVFLCNSAVINGLKDDAEKVFSEKITYKRDNKEIINIIKNELRLSESYVFSKFLYTVGRFKSNNIRVMLRAAKTTNNILNLCNIVKNDEVDIAFVDDLLAMCYVVLTMKYVHNYTCAKFIKLCSENTSISMTLKNDEFTLEQKASVKMSEGSLLFKEVKLLEFIFMESLSSEGLKEYFHEYMCELRSPIQKFKSNRLENDDDIILAKNSLRTKLSNFNYNDNFSNWLRYACYYMDLSEIAGESGEAFIDEQFNTLSLEKCNTESITYLTRELVQKYSKFQYYIDRIEATKLQLTKIHLVELMKESWSEVDYEIYNKYDNFELPSDITNNINVRTLESWSNYDLYVFDSYLTKRYINENKINEKHSIELPWLESLKKIITDNASLWQSSKIRSYRINVILTTLGAIIQKAIKKDGK